MEEKLKVFVGNELVGETTGDSLLINSDISKASKDSIKGRLFLKEEFLNEGFVLSVYDLTSELEVFIKQEDPKTQALISFRGYVIGVGNCKRSNLDEAEPEKGVRLALKRAMTEACKNSPAFSFDKYLRGEVWKKVFFLMNI